MRFLRRNTDSDPDETPADPTSPAEPELEDDDAGNQHRTGITPGKGRPTPKRRDAERRRGPVAPPPRTQREAIRRARGQRSAKTKEEVRAERAERRQKMLAGEDDKYLLPRDRGPVRAYVRDLVDGRRNVMGLFMPMALLVLLTIAVPSPLLQQVVSLTTTALLLLIIVEGVMLGRFVNKRVRQRFPEARTGSGIGFYAFTRATMMRRFRAPRPAVKYGQPPRADSRRR